MRSQWIGDGNAYVTGLAAGRRISRSPPAHSRQSITHPWVVPATTGFVTESQCSNGSALIYSTYLGEAHILASYQWRYAVAVDNSGDAYVTGLTRYDCFSGHPRRLSDDVPRAQSIAGFVAKLKPSKDPAWSTPPSLGGERRGNFAPGIAATYRGRIRNRRWTPEETLRDRTPQTSTDFPRYQQRLADNSIRKLNGVIPMNAFPERILHEVQSAGSGLSSTPLTSAARCTQDVDLAGGDAARRSPWIARATSIGRRGTNSADFPTSRRCLSKTKPGENRRPGFIYSAYAFWITKFDLSQHPTIIDTSIDLTLNST
jgi:hypothetical protein